jgi:hypothetical protein
MVLFEQEKAYVRFDNNSLSRGHVLVVRTVMLPTSLP